MRATVVPVIKSPVRSIIKAPGVIPFGPPIVPDLKSWSTGITLETGVSQWSDQQGTDHITQPATGAQPGRPDSKRIFFDGSQQQFMSKSNFLGLASLNSYTVLILGYPTIVASSQVVLSITAGNAAGVQIDFETLLSPDRSRFLHRSPYGGVGGNRTQKYLDVFLTQPQTYIYRRDFAGNRQSIYIDGDESFLDISPDLQTPLNASGDGLYIGALGTITPFQYFTGYIYQILIYGRALTIPEMTNLSQFLNTKK